MSESWPVGLLFFFFKFLGFEPTTSQSQSGSSANWDTVMVKIFIEFIQKLLVCCDLPTKIGPTLKIFFAILENFFYWKAYYRQIYIHYNLFIINFIFSCSQCFEILYLYEQHFGPWTVYSKRKNLSDLKKNWPTYLPILKLMCRSTANKEYFKDGLVRTCEILLRDHNLHLHGEASSENPQHMFMFRNMKNLYFSLKTASYLALCQLL